MKSLKKESVVESLSQDLFAEKSSNSDLQNCSCFVSYQRKWNFIVNRVRTVLENLEKSWSFKNEFPGPGKVLECCRSLKSLEILTGSYFDYSHGARSSVVTQHVAFVLNTDRKDTKKKTILRRK